MVKGKMRDSNFELLRIFAMVLIIVHHITVHVVYKQLQPGYIYGPGEMFNNIAYYKKLTLLDFGFQAGKIGNALFILITGYFICGKNNVNLDKTIKKLFSQVLFVTLALIWFSIILQCFKKVTPLPTLFYFNDEWWFIGYYFIVVLLGKLFINKYINKIDRNKYRSILLILLAIISFSFSRSFVDGLSSSLSIITTGIFLYLLGGYIKLYDSLKNISSIKLVASQLIIIIISVLSYRNMSLSNMNATLISNSNEYYQSFTYYSEWSLIVLISAIIIFELFKRLKIKSKIINLISETTFMIYLFHDNPFSRSIMNKINFINDLYGNMFKFILLYLIIIIVLFIGIYILYLVYQRIMSYIKRNILI